MHGSVVNDVKGNPTVHALDTYFGCTYDAYYSNHTAGVTFKTGTLTLKIVGTAAEQGKPVTVTLTSHYYDDRTGTLAQGSFNFGYSYKGVSHTLFAGGLKTNLPDHRVSFTAHVGDTFTVSETFAAAINSGSGPANHYVGGGSFLTLFATLK